MAGSASFGGDDTEHLIGGQAGHVGGFEFGSDQDGGFWWGKEWALCGEADEQAQNALAGVGHVIGAAGQVVVFECPVACHHAAQCPVPGAGGVDAAQFDGFFGALDQIVVVDHQDLGVEDTGLGCAGALAQLAA